MYALEIYDLVVRTIRAVTPTVETMRSAIAVLERSLPSTWSVVDRGPRRDGDRSVFEVSVIAPSGTTAALSVVVRDRCTPADVRDLLVLNSLVRAQPRSTVVVAPWMSRRTMDALRQHGVGSIDGTGNVDLELDQPPVVLKLVGEARNPRPRPTPPTNVCGSKATRLLRALGSGGASTTVGALARECALTPGYVSKILGTLEADGVLRRGHRGSVAAVDLPRLVDFWADRYDLFGSNDAAMYLAPQGPRAALESLSTFDGRASVTGSFAAVRHAVVAPPTLLAVYTDDREALATHLGLTPVRLGGDVVLLAPHDDGVLRGVEVADGVRYAEAIQVVVDCATGNGRMPSEGEALLDWLLARGAEASARGRES